MKAFRRLALFATAATTAVMITGAVAAQSTSSNIRVRVVDPAGEPISNVAVSVVHVPTGRTIELQTNSTGLIVARGLAVGGPYIVTVKDEARHLDYGGFTQDNISLELGETESVTLLSRRDLNAATAESVEEINVTAERMLTALRTGPGRDFGQSDIESIPAVGRDFANTLAIDPSIVVDASVPRGPAIGVAGQNFRFNTVTIDGVPQNDAFGLSFNPSATQRSPISLDAIEAIQVNVAPFDVTYGNFLGGNINIVTRSGTNEFHGGAFAFYTDDGLAGDRSGDDVVSLGNFDEVIYGGTFGGPIVKDKLFFFLNYEKFETSRPANALTLLQMAGGDQAVADQLQSDVDRAQSILQNVYGFDAGTFATNDTDEDEKILIKFDWNINDDHRLTAAYQRADGDVLFDDFPNQPVLNSNRYNINERLDSYNVQLFSNWTDKLSTEIRFGYKDVKNRQTSVDASTPEFQIASSVPGFQINAGGDRFRQANELDSSNRLFRIKADYLAGDHTLTLGFEQDHLSVLNTFIPFSRGAISFGSLDDLENRTISTLLYGGSNTGNLDDARANFSIDTNTLYFQDEWAVTDTFTMKLGFRYDFIVNNDEIPFNQNFQDRNGFANTENLDGKSLLAPRFGFNWASSDRLTVRGGAGLFGGGTPIIYLSNSYAANGLTRTFANFYGPFFGGPFPAAFDAVAAALPSGTAVSDNFQQFLSVNPVSEVEAIDPSFQLLSSWKFNIGADYVADFSGIGLGDDWNLTFDLTKTVVQNGYDIREGRRQVIGTAPDGRPIYSNTSFLPDGGFQFNGGDYIVQNTSQGGSTVAAFSFDKAWDTDAGNFFLRGGYTYQDVNDVRSYSRFVAFETFVFDPQADLNNPDLATSLFEITHRITTQFTWEKEFFGDNKTRLSLFYQGRSGRPASFVLSNPGTLPFGGNFLIDAGQADSGTPGNALFYVPTGLTDPIVTGDAGFLQELDAFISSESCLQNARGTILPRNACRGGWVNRIDLNLSQEVTVFDNHKVELILNIENLTNLINSDWGRDAPYTLNTPSNVALADVAINDQGQYVYSESTAFTTNREEIVAQLPSVYRIQFGIRYNF